MVSLSQRTHGRWRNVNGWENKEKTWLHIARDTAQYAGSMGIGIHMHTGQNAPRHVPQGGGGGALCELGPPRVRPGVQWKGTMWHLFPHMETGNGLSLLKPKL